MRTVLEFTLLFTLALVSVSYALVRDELMALKLQCHRFGYAIVNVDENGAIASIKLKPPVKSKIETISEQDQTHFVKIEEVAIPNFDP